MSRLRWPDSTNSVSEKPGTIQFSSQDRRSVKLRVRPPPAGTHQCHRATSAGSGMMLTVKLLADTLNLYPICCAQAQTRSRCLGEDSTEFSST